MNDPFEQSRTEGLHHRLSLLAGEWEGLTRTWFEPGKLADESPTRGVMRLILDPDHVVITVYNISPAGEEAKAAETQYTRRS